MRHFLKPRFIVELTREIKEEGLKAVIKRRGIWLIVGIFVFYLVRDGLVYLLLPYLVAKGVIGAF